MLELEGAELDGVGEEVVGLALVVEAAAASAFLDSFVVVPSGLLVASDVPPVAVPSELFAAGFEDE